MQIFGERQRERERERERERAREGGRESEGCLGSATFGSFQKFAGGLHSVVTQGGTSKDL